MNNRIWHKGPPPHVGWWNASIYADDRAWRWWNGEHWSYVAYPWYPMVSVLKNAGTRSSGEHTEKRIQWTTYWPENALVPRVDPRTNWKADLAAHVKRAEQLYAHLDHTLTTQQLELLTKARERLAATPLDYTYSGVCNMVHEAFMVYGTSYYEARERIDEHIIRMLGDMPWLWNWLLNNRHISAQEYKQFTGHLDYSSDAQMLRMHSKLRATRLAWIDHMINNLKTKGTL